MPRPKLRRRSLPIGRPARPCPWMRDVMDVPVAAAARLAGVSLHSPVLIRAALEGDDPFDVHFPELREPPSDEVRASAGIPRTPDEDRRLIDFLTGGAGLDDGSAAMAEGRWTTLT